MFGMYMSVRNEVTLVGRAIQSAIDSGIDEILVYDDASSDGTREEVQRFRESHPGRVTVVRGEQKAACHQTELHRAVADKMQSQWIIGMGADDVLVPGGVVALKRVVRMWRPALAFGDYRMVDEEGRDVRPPCRCGDEFSRDRSPAEVRARLATSEKHECGVGSFVRRDLFLDLYGRLEAWRMGPWSDSVGLSASRTQPADK